MIESGPAIIVCGPSINTMRSEMIAFVLEIILCSTEIIVSALQIIVSGAETIESWTGLIAEGMEILRSLSSTIADDVEIICLSRAPQRLAGRVDPTGAYSYAL